MNARYFLASTLWSVVCLTATLTLPSYSPLLRYETTLRAVSFLNPVFVRNSAPSSCAIISGEIQSGFLQSQCAKDRLKTFVFYGFNSSRR